MFVEGFEDDLIASDVCPVIADLIEDHPNDEKIQIDILKFLANLCCDSMLHLYSFSIIVPMKTNTSIIRVHSLFLA